jgi:hypothetical protein
MTLRPLSAIDPAVVRDGLDVRGWSVIAIDGTLLGAVAELIVDVEYGAPVYINIVPVGQSGRVTHDECWVRVPVRHTALDEARHRVILSDVATLGLGTATAGLASSRGVRF